MLQTTQTTPTPAEFTTDEARTRRIRDLNDEFRKSGAPACLSMGRKLMTSGVRALGAANTVAIALKVITFNAFDESNDPHGEHDFGSFDHNGETIFWKIDYYAHDMERGSPDPADPAVTCRVLTVLLASEY